MSNEHLCQYREENEKLREALEVAELNLATQKAGHRTCEEDMDAEFARLRGWEFGDSCKDPGLVERVRARVIGPDATPGDVIRALRAELGEEA